MSQAHARWFLVAGLSSSLLFACGSDELPPGGDNTAGTSSTAGTTASAAGSGTQGGSDSGSGGGGNAAGSTASAGTAGSAAGGGGATAGSGGSMAGDGAGGSSAGTGGDGAGGSAAGSGGSGGGGAGELKAVATITGVGTGTGKFTGTATFTQGETMTKLELSLTACPNGPLVSHLHLNPDCGDNGNAAGNHWVPNGENLGNYTCSGGTAMLTVEKPVAQWTVGGAAATDITKHSFMVHEGMDPSPGARVGCGVITKL